MAHAFSPNYSGDWGRRIAGVQEFWAEYVIANQVSTVSLASLWWPPGSEGPQVAQGGVNLPRLKKYTLSHF